MYQGSSDESVSSEFDSTDDESGIDPMVFEPVSEEDLLQINQATKKFKQTPIITALVPISLPSFQISRHSPHVGAFPRASYLDTLEYFQKLI